MYLFVCQYFGFCFPQKSVELQKYVISLILIFFIAQFFPLSLTFIKFVFDLFFINFKAIFFHLEIYIVGLNSVISAKYVGMNLLSVLSEMPLIQKIILCMRYLFESPFKKKIG